MRNRLVGPDGQPIDSKAPEQVVSARMSSRATLEHEPRDILIEVELLVPSLALMQKAVGRVNDLVCALGQHVTVRAPVMKVRYFVDKDHFDQAVAWGNQIATVGGGGAVRMMTPLKEKPAEDPGAEPGDPPAAG